jgi:ABC-type nitrate/sulfonate/bicarbonate transport system substrate-binding protein
MKSLYIPLAGLLLSVLVSVAGAGQRGLQKLTVGYAPVSGAALPLFIPIEEKLFQKYGYDVSGIFMGSSQLINTALLTGELLLGYAGGGGVISSRLAGSDLVAIASPLPVLTIDGWAKPEIKSIAQVRGKRIGITRFGGIVFDSGKPREGFLGDRGILTRQDPHNLDHLPK